MTNIVTFVPQVTTKGPRKELFPQGLNEDLVDKAIELLNSLNISWKRINKLKEKQLAHMSYVIISIRSNVDSVSSSSSTSQQEIDKLFDFTETQITRQWTSVQKFLPGYVYFETIPEAMKRICNLNTIDIPEIPSQLLSISFKNEKPSNVVCCYLVYKKLLKKKVDPTLYKKVKDSFKQ